jgi:DNA-binding MarR family transcriptional regulator
MLRRWLRRRRERREMLVLYVLGALPWITGADIADHTGLSSGALYPVLFGLEGAKRIQSRWLPGDYPRGRAYALADEPIPEDTTDA